MAKIANCCLIFTAFIAVFAAIIAGLYLNQSIPEGMPEDQAKVVRAIGVFVQISSSLCYAAAFIGIGKSRMENEKTLEKWFTPKVKLDESEKYVDFYDDKIANVPVRVFKPKNLDPDKNLKGYVYLHGGGWTIGSVDMFHSFTYRLAKEANVILISVDYRLAPEHTFPAHFDDCYAVVRTLLATGDKYGIDTNRLVVGGDSAGGNLATAVALKLRDEGKRLAAQVLIYPAVQFMDFSLPSIQTMSTIFLTKHQMATFWSYYLTGTPDMAEIFLANNHSLHLRNTKYSSYLGSKDKGQGNPQVKPMDGIPKAVLDALTDYRASPLMADNLKGLPDTLLITCEFDVLRDEGVLYKARLLDAGVKVTHYNYMSYHPLFLVQNEPSIASEEFNKAFQDLVDYLKQV